MKSIKALVVTCMFAMLSFAVVYAGEAKTKAYDTGTEQGYDFVKSVSAPLAQAQLPDTTDKFENTVVDIADGLGIPIDTVSSIDDIVDSGIYYVKNPPPKGATVKEWITYILTGLGWVLSLILIIRQKIISNRK